jgi:hypothetical protein
MDDLERAAIQEERWHALPAAPLYNRLAGNPAHDQRINIVIDACRRNRTATHLRQHAVIIDGEIAYPCGHHLCHSSN